MLKLYDHLDAILENDRFPQTQNAIFRHWASELMESLGYTDWEELNRSLSRSIEVCCSMNISVAANFKRVYRFSGEELHEDWLLSDLGGYLLILNGNSGNRHVARAQLYWIVAGLKKRAGI
jgi:hypothetical protein